MGLVCFAVGRTLRCWLWRIGSENAEAGCSYSSTMPFLMRTHGLRNDPVVKLYCTADSETCGIDRKAAYQLYARIWAEVRGEPI